MQGIEMSPGIVSALERTGIESDHAVMGYRRVKDPETGSFDTILWKKPKPDQEDMIDRIHARLSDVPKLPKIKQSGRAQADLMGFIAIVDLHLAMRAYQEESGEDYDTEKAAARLISGVSTLLDEMPACENILIANLGDYFHATDDSGATYKSKHPLDMSDRMWRFVDVGVDATVVIIEKALKKHKRVIYRSMRGNHDETAHYALTIGIAQRYFNNPRLEVDKGPSDAFAKSWGDCLIGLHHGDKAKPRELADWLKEHPDYSRTYWRDFYTGHIHHEKAAQFGGVRWRSLPAACPLDAWGASNMFVSRASMSAMVYHKTRGKIHEFTENFRP